MSACGCIPSLSRTPSSQVLLWRIHYVTTVDHIIGCIDYVNLQSLSPPQTSEDGVFETSSSLIGCSVPLDNGHPPWSPEVQAQVWLKDLQ